MRGLSVGLAVLLWTIGGVGVELAHPVFFASEPVELWAVAGTPEPQLLWGGEVQEAKWTSSFEDGRVRWSANLPPDVPRGPWQVCLADGPCRTFLRVEDEMAILVVAAPPGSTVTVVEERAVVGERGEVFFVLPPGAYVLRVLLPDLAEPIEQDASLRKGERTEVIPLQMTLRLSAEQVLPGYAFTLWARVLGLAAPLAEELALEVPPGWRARRDLGVVEPEAAWEVLVPEDFLGEGTLRTTVLPLGLERTVNVSVSTRLPLEVVTAHWNVNEDRLDLTEIGELTYDRVRWAASLRGEQMPHTGITVTRAHVDELARKWQEQ